MSIINLIYSKIPKIIASHLPLNEIVRLAAECKLHLSPKSTATRPINGLYWQPSFGYEDCNLGALDLH